MSPENIVERVVGLEEQMVALRELPGKVDDLALQVAQRGKRTDSGFSAVRTELRAEIRAPIDETRAEMRELNAETRGEKRALNEETRTHMRLLHEEVISRIALLQEALPARRRRTRKHPA